MRLPTRWAPPAGVTTAHWDGDRLTVHDASQFIFGVKALPCGTFGLKPENVRVHSPFVGGGFGSKGNAWPHVRLAAAAAAKVVGRPVKLPLTREQMYGTVGDRTHRPSSASPSGRGPTAGSSP